MQHSFIPSLTLLGSAAACHASASVDGLSWMTGCWASVGAEPGSGEQWTTPAGGTILGVSRTVLGTKTPAYEFMLIRETELGGMEFVAKPSGQTGATFSMIRQSEHKIVFENKNHDFPQRVVYRLDSGGNLVGGIEGETKGTQKSIDFPMARVQCAAGVPNH